MQAHTTTNTHTWSHTHTQSHKVSHTQIQSNTESHTERNRHTQLHTGPWRHRTMGALSGLAAAGEEGATAWTEEAVGAVVPAPSLPQHPKPLASSRSHILLGPGFTEGLGSQMTLPQPPAMSGGRGRAPPWPRLPLGLWKLRVLMFLCPPGICLSAPQCRAWKSGRLGSALNL